MTVAGLIMRAAWPAYASVADAMMFTPPMMIRVNWPLKKKAPKGGTTGPDRALKRLRHMFNWAIRVGIVDSSPFRKAHISVITFETEDGRTRRLEDGEEARLRAAAQHDDQHVARQTAWLDDLIVAALETGCRQGELLKLQWSQVHWPMNRTRGHLFLPSIKTKTKRDRSVPITKPLLAILEMRKHGPDGAEHEPDAYVFGNRRGRFARTSRRSGTVCSRPRTSPISGSMICDGKPRHAGSKAEW